MERLIIDRFEGDLAVCEREDLSMVDIPKDKLPKGAREDDCLLFDGNGYTVDSAETKARKERIQKKMDALFKD